ncbi:MAG: hypothetical protein GY754_30330 [bacterium]|nr:hypothetical protein [bacterium]
MKNGFNYLQSFNPAISNPELLEHTLIARKKLVDELEELVIESANTGNKFQRLIIGPRGSGKTHTLKVLHNRLFSRTDLEDKLIIAYLCEDEYGVATFLDWIIRLLRSFIKWYPERAELLEKEIEGLKKTPEDDREKIATRILLNYIEGKTVLIIVENIGNIFHNVKGFGKTGQQKFRDLVQQRPYFTIVASNQAIFGDVKNIDMPFHNFFRATLLEKLSFEQSIQLLRSIAGWDKNIKLLDFLNTDIGKGRIRAIYDLVGGNHRLLVAFYTFLKNDYLKDLSESFMKTINDLIPYYQSMMDLLSSQQQKIVQYLCQVRIAVTGKDIAENCFSSQNVISKQMTNLVRLKYIDVNPSGKEAYYELSEPLLRICYEIKENREGPIKLFVDFLGNFYTAEEIKKNYIKHSIQESSHEQAYYKEALKRYFPDDILNIFEKVSKDVPLNSEKYPSMTGSVSRVKEENENKYLVAKDTSIIMSIFEILRRHNSFQPEQLEIVKKMLTEKFKDDEEMIVPLKFLDIGIRHLKKNEKNVLYKLTKEERAAFKRFVLDRIEK